MIEGFYIAGLVQAIFFVLLILTKKQKQPSDYFLASFIAVLGGNLLFAYAIVTKIFMQYSIFIVIDIFYWILLGPTLYIYTRLITSDNKFRRIYLLYFIPAVLVLIGFSEYLLGDVKTFFTSTSDWFMYKIAEYIWYYNSPVFYILTIIYLRKHRARIKDYFSYSKDVDLKWLYFLSHGFALFLISILLNKITADFFNTALPFSTFKFSWLVVTLYVFGIGFFGYKQKGIFTGSATGTNDIAITQDESKVVPENVFPINSQSNSYLKSGLNEEESARILESLETLMMKDQLYLDCELDLVKLAKKTRTSTHKLSQTLNEKLNKNFFEYINEFRLNDVKRQLLNPEYENFKILSIAYECGFNSKSTFYSFFKKYENMTPAEYRQKYQKTAG